MIDDGRLTVIVYSTVRVSLFMRFLRDVIGTAFDGGNPL